MMMSHEFWIVLLFGAVVGGWFIIFMMGPRRPMWRFTPAAKNDILLAKRVAEGRGSRTIEVSDVLTAMLLDTDSAASRMLAAIEEDPTRLCRNLGGEAARLSAATTAAGPKLSKGACGALEAAMDEAVGRRAVGTEHLLLGALVQISSNLEEKRTLEALSLDNLAAVVLSLRARLREERADE